MRTLLFSVLIFALASVGGGTLVSCNNEGNTDSTGTMDRMGADSLPPDNTGHAMHDTLTMPMADHAIATISGTKADTTVEGKANFDLVDGKVKMTLTITVPKLAGKSVAVHLHEHGDCGDNGNMSHGHWNPTKVDHGKWGTEPFHLGDIGNVKLDGKGVGSTTLETNLWTLGGSMTSNIIGRAVIVHSGVDDYKSQPAGNAGSRIGCGVIQ